MERVAGGSGAELCTVVAGITGGKRAGDVAGEAFELGVDDVEVINKRCEFAVERKDVSAHRQQSGRIVSRTS